MLLINKLIFSDTAEHGKAGASSDEEEVETAQEKKLRLAKQYLAALEKEGNTNTLLLLLTRCGSLTCTGTDSATVEVKIKKTAHVLPVKKLDSSHMRGFSSISLGRTESVNSFGKCPTI